MIYNNTYNFLKKLAKQINRKLDYKNKTMINNQYYNKINQR